MTRIECILLINVPIAENMNLALGYGEYQGIPLE